MYKSIAFFHTSNRFYPNITRERYALQLQEILLIQGRNLVRNGQKLCDEKFSIILRDIKEEFHK
jgi:hypothetical protein